MLKTLRKILELLLIGEEKKFYWLVTAIIFMSIFEMLGVASVLPFLNVISNPEAIQTNSQLKWAYDRFGFTNKNSFLIVLGMGSFVVLVVSNVLRAGVALALLRFTWLKRYIISKQLLSQYLYGPYAFFLNRNTSELTAYLVAEVSHVVSGVLIPSMQVFARCLLAALILVLLFAMEPVVALVVIGIIGGGYTAIYIFARKKLSRTGGELLKNSKKMYKALHEAFGGIKDIKLLGREHIFIEQFGEPTKKCTDYYCSQFLISQFPRYAFEVMTFGGVLFATLYIAVIKNDYQQVIPVIGLYIFSAYRLMPALQQIFQEITLIRFTLPTLETIYEDYVNCTQGQSEQTLRPGRAMPFTQNVELRNVTFKYPKAERSVIENFDLTVHANTTIGFVGGTGAGKTTLVDIFLGLLSPQQGEIIVDDIKLNADNLRAWQANIGYVPQHIYLCDDTVTRNIAFGVPDNEIDLEAVQRAARLANIHDFITKELRNGYETEVGDRGVRLSGGQRQRIGIARAMYHDPSFLVFDEATSALDGITEDTILDAIRNLTHKKTIIIIAHRLSTVQECDIIYLLDQGRIVTQGTYQELLANNQQFRKMAKVYEKDSDRLQPLTEATE